MPSIIALTLRGAVLVRSIIKFQLSNSSFSPYLPRDQKGRIKLHDYKWKSKFGGMEVSDVTKMRTLHDENRRLRKVVADLVLEKEALKIIAEGNF